MGRGRCLPRLRKAHPLSQDRWLKGAIARRRCARPSIDEILVAPVTASWLAFNLRWGRDQGSR